MRKYVLILLACTLLVITYEYAFGQSSNSEFSWSIKEKNNPITNLQFKNDPADFQFAILCDVTGGERYGVLEDAVEKLNLLNPEFVISVGDLIAGDTKDPELLKQSWDRFNNSISKLEMPFFYVPGNHDIGTTVLSNIWIEKYSFPYYHFVYKDVLFLVLNSTADKDSQEVPSSEQIDYFKKVLKKEKDVKHTILFLHHPLWVTEHTQNKNNLFTELEDELKNRPYSVFAGHTHNYFYEKRNNANYYVLATTGGSSALEGPNFGRFDHITWVTMEDNLPQVANISIKGILHKDIYDKRKQELSKELIKASEFSSSVIWEKDSKGLIQKGKGRLVINNTSSDTMFFNANFLNHNQFKISTIRFYETVMPHESKELTFGLECYTLLNEAVIAPLWINYSLYYATETYDPLFALSGDYKVIMNLSNRSIDNSDNRNYINGFPVFYPVNITTNPGLLYHYYEGFWRKVPNLFRLKTLKTGVAENFDLLSMSRVVDFFGFMFTGYIEIPEEAVYTFRVTADDGAKLLIHERLITSGKESTGQIALLKGKHPFTIFYYEYHEKESLKIEYSTDNTYFKEISSDMFSY